MLANDQQAVTPWGVAEDAVEVAPGITRYDTPSHGGYHLSEERLAQMAEDLRIVETFAGRGS